MEIMLEEGNEGSGGEVIEGDWRKWKEQRRGIKGRDF